MIRSCNAVLVDLPEARLVARVESLGGEAVSRRIASAARHFARCGAPTLRLIHAEPPVTLWPSLAHGPTIAARELGALIRELHDRTREPDDPELLPLCPFLEIRALLARLASDPRFDPRDHHALTEHTDALELRWRALAGDDPLGRVLVHGDVHTDNVMLADGEPVLIDLELAGVGPATWDFVQLGAAVHRYGLRPARFDQFAAGYGADPRSWVGFEVLRDSYELLAVAWAAAYRHRSPAFAREARIRVDGLLGRADATWTLI